MSFGSPSPPPSPNPYAVAAAQTSANVSTAIANAFLANANVVSPQGTSTFTQTGSYTLADPQYDSSGNLTSTTNRTIPIFTQTIQLSTTGQSIYAASQSMQLKLNTLGANQLDTLSGTLGTAFSLASLPNAASGPSAPTLNDTITQPVAIQTSVGAADLSADKEAVVNAVLTRLEYQSTISRNIRIAELANMGILPGSEAYANEMAVFDFQVTDGRLQAILAGGQEQTRLFQIDLAKGKFKNEAADLDFRQRMLIVDFSNRTALQRFQTLSAVADFINTFRERRMQEVLTERNQPLNELSAMLHGGQIQIPSYTGFKAAPIENTPLGDYIYRSAQIDQQNYQTKVAQQQAMIGGIAQLGGAALAAPMTGGGSLGGAIGQRMIGGY